MLLSIIKKHALCFLVMSAIAFTPAFAQKTVVSPEGDKSLEYYDPLIPQNFAFDKENNLFVGISSVTNTIDLIHYSTDTLYIKKRITIDVVEGRHDVKQIYFPKGVAIYENHIVYLTANIDSCHFTVLDIDGGIVSNFSFEGAAQAFSYDPTTEKIYIAGDNPGKGYDIVVLDVANGFDNITVVSGHQLHVRKDRKADELFKQDPSGIVLALIAMTTVFSALILLYIVFKVLGNYQVRRQNKKSKKCAEDAASADGTSAGTSATATASVQNPGDISGEVFAAIASTIYTYQNELHDEEITIITIDKVSRNYSPWSSKLYGLNTYYKR
jgi:Na+-transporting methylmalonyl-CoA/oxaloacetate decarboxylase gamma subunit